MKYGGLKHGWPEARGIFRSKDKHFNIKMHEEDEIRIISKDKGADIHKTYERLARAVTAMEEILTFARTDHLGYISSCPTNIGTGLRALVRVNLP